MDSNNNDAPALNQEKAEKKISLRADTHSFDTDIAKDYGIDVALMYKHVTHWVNYNKARKTNFNEGRYWFYNTIDEIAAHFPYWSAKQVERILKKMFDLKLILKGNFNKTPMDRTGWYTVNYEKEMHIPKSGNGNPEIGAAIPNTNTNTKKTLSKDNVKQDAIASTPISISKDKLIERAPFVSTTEKQHEKLLADFGEEATLGSYLELSDWKEFKTPKERKGSDYKRIQSWGIDRYYQKKQRLEKRKNYVGGETNKELALKIAKEFNPKIAKEKGIRIDVTSTAMLFIFTQSAMESQSVLFKENGFREQVNSLMRKYKLI